VVEAGDCLLTSRLRVGSCFLQTRWLTDDSYPKQLLRASGAIQSAKTDPTLPLTNFQWAPRPLQKLQVHGNRGLRVLLLQPPTKSQFSLVLCSQFRQLKQSAG